MKVLLLIMLIISGCSTPMKVGVTNGKIQTSGSGDVFISHKGKGIQLEVDENGLPKLKNIFNLIL